MLQALIRFVMVAGLLCAGGSAFAQARHERVEVKPIKAKGKVVGAHIKANLRPHGTYNKVQLVLGKVEPNKWSGSTYRDAATGKTSGYVVHKGPEKANVKNGDEVIFELHYGKGNPFKGGETLDLTSIWTSTTQVGLSTHVWGMTRQGVASRAITLPPATEPAGQGPASE